MRGSILTAGGRLLGLLFVFTASLSVAALRAGAEPPPTLVGSGPLFVQRGQSTDVTIDGGRLDAVNAIYLSNARGLRVSLVDPDKGAKPDPAHLRLHLAADVDAALGTREIRLISPGGVCPPVSISVGQYPLVVEREPNNTAEQAQDVSLPATLSGKIDAPGDIDCYRFTASKGEQLVFNVHAARERSALDPQIAVHNEAGREAPIRIDLNDGDPIAIFDVPTEGRYTLSVRDLQYRGGGEFAYRIDAGAIPYVQSVLPMSVQPGKMAEVRPVGVNLNGAETMGLDLTYARAGELSVRARAASGLSNAVKLDVNERPAFVDGKPAHSADGAVLVPAPVDVSGRIINPSEENFVKFHVGQKQAFTLETTAKALGSPLAAVLTLRNVKGEGIAGADASNGSEPSITRDLDPGDYVLSVRDLFFGGGPRYTYRLSIRAANSRPQSTQDFNIRMLPDALRVARGGRAPLFVDLRRAGDFDGDVTVEVEDLPRGVTCSPIVIGEKKPGFSGMLVVSAAADAPLGSFPIHVRALGFTANGMVTRTAVPMVNGKEAEQAFVSVVDGAAFTIESGASLDGPRVQQLSTEADALSQKLSAANAQRAAAQTEWEKTAGQPLAWATLDDATVTSVNGTEFKKQDDGSFLAVGPSPDVDTYTFTAKTTLAGISALRLEVLPDASLPNKGPGRNASGNFVLTRISATIAPAADPTKAAPVKFAHAIADFSQDDYDVSLALENQPGKGWAMFPRGGTPNQAIFFIADPAGTDASVLTITLDQRFSMQHTLGRFRFSVTSDPQAPAKAGIPRDVAAVLATPADKRSPEDAARVSGYHASIDPATRRDQARVDAIRGFIADAAELGRLDAALAPSGVDVKAEQEAWEKAALAGQVWLPIDVSAAKAQSGANMKIEPDGAVLVGGADPMNDVYTITGATSAEHLTALRLEALPDASLPSGGPGRNANGNFVLTSLNIYASPRDAMEMKPPVVFNAAHATFEQADFTAARVLTGAKDAGWAILPNAGKPSVATFYAAEPFGAAGGSSLTIELGHNFTMGHHTLGHFRVWTTANADPDHAPLLPQAIYAALKQPADKRDERQKRALADNFRGMAPSLEPLRRRWAELKARSDSLTYLARGRKFTVPFLLNRSGFDGDVQVSLEGFTSTRDANTGAPVPTSQALKFQPLTVSATKTAMPLDVEVEGGSGTGPRYVVLKAEGKSGDETRVEYSAPFILYVAEK